MNVEIKPAPGFDEQTGRVVAEWSKHRFANQAVLPLFSSFSFIALDAAKKAAPEIPRGYLLDSIPADWRQLLDRLGAVALHTNQVNLALSQAQAVKSAGFGLFCYTVNDPARAREILSWGVDAFCTDRIDLIGAGFA
jgi:glycerophosphoryl diester phosphodiesterase